MKAIWIIIFLLLTSLSCSKSNNTEVVEIVASEERPTTDSKEKIETKPNNPNEYLIDKLLYIGFDESRKENGKILYQNLRVYLNEPEVLIERFSKPQFYWDIEGIKAEDSFTAIHEGSTYRLAIKYFIKNNEVKWASECVWKPKKDKLSIAEVLKKYNDDKVEHKDTITGDIGSLVHQGDKAARDYVMSPTEAQKQYHRYNDGVGSYRGIVLAIKLFDKYGCKWN